nr:hypothetical protein [Tanacetum cinerariifolium]
MCYRSYILYNLYAVATRVVVESYLPVIMNPDYLLIVEDMSPAQMTSASTHATDAASSSQLGRLHGQYGFGNNKTRHANSEAELMSSKVTLASRGNARVTKYLFMYNNDL